MDAALAGARRARPSNAMASPPPLDATSAVTRALVLSNAAPGAVGQSVGLATALGFAPPRADSALVDAEDGGPRDAPGDVHCAIRLVGEAAFVASAPPPAPSSLGVSLSRWRARPLAPRELARPPPRARRGARGHPSARRRHLPRRRPPRGRGARLAARARKDSAHARPRLRRAPSRVPRSREGDPPSSPRRRKPRCDRASTSSSFRATTSPPRPPVLRRAA